MRLDKMLAHSGYGSRKDVKLLIRKGSVYVNGEVIIDDDYKIDEAIDEVLVDGYAVDYKKHHYIMINKPQGVISATYDAHKTTVIDLVSEYNYVSLFPIGRLDIDTEGLLLLSNDGVLAHQLLSPKNMIEKEYLVKVKSPLKASDITSFKKGIVLDDGYNCLSSNLKIINDYEALVIIYEGKFHQIKRMFEALNNEVIYLKRLRMKNLVLDETLKTGEYRELSGEEIEKLMEDMKK